MRCCARLPLALALRIAAHPGLGNDVSDEHTCVLRDEVAEALAEGHGIEGVGDVAHEHEAVAAHEAVEAIPQQVLCQGQSCLAAVRSGRAAERRAGLTVAVPFNDAEAMDRRVRRLIAESRKPACLIMEAALMNMRVILREPGYLEAVRQITRQHGHRAYS